MTWNPRTSQTRRKRRNLQAARRVRSRPRKRRGRTPRAATIHDRLANAGLILAAAGLAMAHLCLIRIGPPPAVRINPLWVLDHQGIVEAVIWATVLAGAGSALPITLGRRRVAVIVLWVLATAAALAFFSDRLLIIGRILLSRAG